MERYKCRLCFKSFVNGRALGGHMRSHMFTLSSKRDLYEQEEEMERPSQLSDDVTESDASSSSSDNNQKRNRLDDDEEEETETINLTRKRSKRTRKLGSFDFDVKKTSRLGDSVVTEPEQRHSSAASDTTTEEDLAFCLIMLSRDKWKQQKKKKIKIVEDEETDQECEEDYKNRGRFKCETCGKVFKSYQALGGHRASHKKNKNYAMKTEYVVNGGVKEKRVHQCPICFRVFSSGQALGGHKRSHGSINGTGGGGAGLSEEVLLVKQRMIDLNLPAPNEDDEIETSLVYDEW